MNVLRLLLGRRQFLTGFAGSVLALGLWKFAHAIDAVFQTNIAKKPARGIVVYFSGTGNTASIAKAIHRGMNSIIPCDVIQITKLNPKKMAKYDLVAIGSPNWSMRTPIEVWTFTHDMPRMDGKHCVLFGTHGTRPIGQFWFVSRNLLKKGMTVIGWGDWYGASLQERTPHLAWGHPDVIDLAEAEAFGKRMAESSVRIYAGETELIPELPTPDVRYGSAENPWTPLVRNDHITFANPPPDSIPQFDLSKCVYPRCNLCEEICPVHAIDFSVMAPAGNVTPAGTVVTQDAMDALDWSVHPTIGQNYPLVVKQACQHCGALCQEVCRYDAIAYFGESKRRTQKINEASGGGPAGGGGGGPAKGGGKGNSKANFNPFLDAWWNKGMDPEMQFSGGMNQSELLANPRFRNLVRKVDLEHPIDPKGGVRLPSELWPEQMDDKS
jgi:ferredoxin/flavodoxin